MDSVAEDEDKDDEGYHGERVRMGFEEGLDRELDCVLDVVLLTSEGRLPDLDDGLGLVLGEAAEELDEQVAAAEHQHEDELLDADLVLKLVGHDCHRAVREEGRAMDQDHQALGYQALDPAQRSDGRFVRPLLHVFFTRLRSIRELISKL